MKTNIIWSVLLPFLLIGLTSCAGQAEEDVLDTVEVQAPPAVIAEGHLMPKASMYLAFPVGGRVSEILVEEGERVRAGQELARLGNTEQAEAALAGARLELAMAQQAMDSFIRTAGLAHAQYWQVYLDAQAKRAITERLWEGLDLDAIQARVDAAEGEVRDRQEALTDARKTVDRYADLELDNPVRTQAEDALTQAQENLNEARRKLETAQRERESVRSALDLALASEAEAKRQYEATLEGPDIEQSAIMEGRLEAAKAQLAAAEWGLTNYSLKAPFSGVVTDINIQVGELTGPERWAVLIADFSEWTVETSDLSELEVVRIKEGQLVTVVLDALPELTLTGSVESISDSFSLQSGDILYTVKIRIKEAVEAIRWGMTVEVQFEAEE